MKRSVALPGTRLEYEVQGEAAGASVLLLHPWFGCWRFWEPVLPALGGGRWLLPDLYSPAAGDWQAAANPAALAKGLLALLDLEGVDSCRLAGNSMGGVLGQLLASGWPDRVSHLALIGTGARSSRLQAGFRATLDRWRRERDPALLAELTRGLVAPRAAGHPQLECCAEALAALDPGYLAAVPASTLGLDLRPRLPSITAATLVIRGELDGIRSREHSAELVASIPGARALEMEGAGHSPMLDSPRELASLLRAFFQL